MSSSTSLPAASAGRHAIVYGGSIAGLSAAGLLSRHFECVTLVERDRFESGPQPRKGVAQSTQVHALLMRGMNALCDIFPGFQEDLLASGGKRMDMTEDNAWLLGGFWLPRIRSGITVATQSRPLLEWVIRQRLQALPNVRVLDGREVTGFQTGTDKARVTGIQFQAPGGGQEEALEGELVVDASGRGSRTPQWLESLGFPRVEETRIHVDVRYATCVFQRPPGFAPGWEAMTLLPKLPEQRVVGVIQPIEGNRWLALVGGWRGHGPATADHAGFLEFARSLPHLHEAIRNAEPLGPVHHYRFSHNQRRHYERMPRFPEGLAVVGDAFCSFNPIYGQGMTMGALQAHTLGEGLRHGLPGLSQRYRRQVGRLLQAPWSMATNGDLRIPEVEGKRPPGLGLMNWYSDRFQRLASHDEEALLTFTRVMHMVDSPAAMFSPRLVLKVLTARCGAAPQKHQPEPVSAARNQAA